MQIPEIPEIPVGSVWRDPRSRRRLEVLAVDAHGVWVRASNRHGRNPARVRVPLDPGRFQTAPPADDWLAVLDSRYRRVE